MNKPLALNLESIHSNDRARRFAANTILVLAGSWFVALTAQLSVPLPFTPVPITGQTLGVLLVGAALGSNRGALSLLFYLAQGAIGFPFFADGSGGVSYLFGGTAGYLLGFVAAAFLVGRLSERGWDRSWKTSVASFTLGTLVIFACGYLWLSTLIGFEAAFFAGVLPFIPGAIVKIAVAVGSLNTAWKFVKKIEE